MRSPGRARASAAATPRGHAHRSQEGGTVSVVVPCYNYGRYLRGAVESVLAQRGVEVDVLIIDDASTDDTRAVATALAANPRVETRRHPGNRGHIATYNEGLTWASGTYTVLLSADDLLTPGALARARDLLDAHPEVGFVYGRPRVVRGDGPLPPARGGRGRWRIQAGHEWLATRCRTIANCIKSPEVVARTRLLEQLGGYRPELPHLADFEMWMRLAAHADVGYIRGADQAYYRDHPAGMHRRPLRSPLTYLSELKAAFETLFRHHGHAIPDGERLQDTANRALAAQALTWACLAYDRGWLATMEVEALETFAGAVYGDVSSLGEHAGLRWRKRLGSGPCAVLGPFMALTFLRRLRVALRRRLSS